MVSNTHHQCERCRAVYEAWKDRCPRCDTPNPMRAEVPMVVVGQGTSQRCVMEAELRNQPSDITDAERAQIGAVYRDAAMQHSTREAVRQERIDRIVHGVLILAFGLVVGGVW